MLYWLIMSELFPKEINESEAVTPPNRFALAANKALSKVWEVVKDDVKFAINTTYGSFLKTGETFVGATLVGVGTVIDRSPDILRILGLGFAINLLPSVEMTAQGAMVLTISGALAGMGSLIERTLEFGPNNLRKRFGSDAVDAGINIMTLNPLSGPVMEGKLLEGGMLDE